MLAVSSSVKYSVIVPALNEESCIRLCLKNITKVFAGHEILLIDGGSTDQTLEIAQQFNVKVLSSPKGRGVQCNFGARHALGDILVFVHVDTLIDFDAVKFLDVIFLDSHVRIGTFRLKFDYMHWFLNLCGFLTRFDSVFTRFGDQVIIVRKDFFEQIGGFPDWPLFEDVHFLNKARRLSKLHSFPKSVITSARKFKNNGVFRQQFRNGILIFKYILGVKPEKLAKIYNGDKNYE